MKAAAGMLGVPLSKLTRAKRLGCPAFANGRVDLDGLKTWLANRAHKKLATPAKQADEIKLAIGAPAALKRLEEAEAASYTALQTALGSGDPDTIGEARRGWLAVSEQLRRHDLAVEQFRRESGDLVERREVEAALTLLAGQLRQLSEGSLPWLVGAIQSERDEIRCREILARAGWYEFTGSIAAGIQAKVPAWILKALARESQSHLTGDTLAEAEKMVPILQELGGELAKLATAHTPPAPSKTIAVNTPTALP